MNTSHDLASTIASIVQNLAVRLVKTKGMDAHNRSWDTRNDAVFIWPAVGMRVAMLMLLLSASLVWSTGVMATTSINKQFTAATIDPGNISKFRITITNTSAVALTAAAVTDNLPAQITISNPANSVNTCGFSGVTASPGSSQIKLTGGTIPAASGSDGLCYFEVDVTATAAGNWINTIPANGPTNGFTPGGAVAGYQATENVITVTNTTSASATLSVRGLSPPTGSKSFSPSPGLVGEPVTLTITLTNPSSNNTTMPLTTFVDTLPTGMVVAPTPAASVSCTGTGAVNGTFSPSPGATSLTLTGGTIGGATGSGGTCVLSVKVVVNSITSTSQSFTNSISTGAIGNTRGLTSSAFNKNETINSPISLSKSFSPSTVGVNQNSVLQITITNASSVTPLTISSLTDSLPSGLTVGNLTTNPPTIVCSGTGSSNGAFSPALAQGDTSITIAGSIAGTSSNKNCVVKVPVRAAAAGSYNNTIAADAVQNPGNLRSPSVSATLTVNSNLTVAKSRNPTSVAAGQPTTFTVTINNWSAGAVSGINFTDNLPVSNTGGFQMVLANPVGRTASAGCSGGTWIEVPGTSSISWIGGTIAGGNPGVCTITFKAITPIDTPIGRTFINQIPLGSICSGSVCNTNAITSGTTVTVIAGASVSKAFSPSSVAQGQTSQLTVTLTNATATPITNAAITDNLPATVGHIVVVADVPGASTTCVGGAVTALANSGSVMLSGATIPANGSCTFRVNVKSGDVGTHTNTIPIGALTSNEGVTNPAAATANLTITTGITGSKSFSPASVANGGVSRVTIQINNVSAGSLTGVSVVDGPMTNLVVANPANATTTCAGTTSITATPGANTASLSGATIVAGGNCLFLFDVLTSGNPSNWPNSLAAGKITSAEGISNTASISATLNKSTTSIGINKSFNPVTVTGGQPSVLQIDVTNPIGSPSVANNVTFTDTFPSGIQVYSVPNAHTNCTNGVISATPGGSSIALSGATLPANSTCSVYVTTTSVKFLNLTNTIAANAISTTQGYTNSQSTAASLTTLQGLGVSKSFTPTSISTGQTARLKIKLVSTRDSTQPNTQLNGVSFTDTLPTGLTVASNPNATTACGGTVDAIAGSNLVTLSGATIAPETSCLVEVDVTASALGVYSNIIPVGGVTGTSAGSGGSFSNQSPATATLNVLNPPIINKAFNPAAVKAGQTSTLTITIANSNAQAFTGAALTDNLPAGLTIASTPNASTTCSGGAVAALVAGSSISLTNGTIPANGSCTFQADVVSNTSAIYPNTIPIGALTTIEGASNTTIASATLTILEPPTLTKSFSPTTINVGSTSTLTITLGNSNASAITLNSPLTDSLPGTLTVASTPNIVKTCPGTVTAAANGNTITYANGSSIPAGGCTIQVNITGSLPGGNQNFILAGALQTSAGNNLSSATATLNLVAVAIGNRVWLDDGAGAGIANNGIQDGSEAGISGVAVQLYTEAGTLVTSTTTNPNGYYYFDNLAPGTYYAKIPLTEFGSGETLFNMLSSTGADSSQTIDLNDNGIDNANPSVNGIQTNSFTLALETMPTGEDQTGYPGLLSDNNVNATNDFGFLLQPEVAVTKTNNSTSVNAGGTTTYTITVTNNGPGSANNTVLTDPAATGLTKTGTPSCIASGGAVCPSLTNSSLEGAGVTVATLPSGGSLTLTITANVTATSGAVANSVTATLPTDIIDLIPSNNTATDTDTVNLVADLSITKSNGVSSVNAGGSTVYTVVVTNNGPSEVTAATIVDIQPIGLSFGAWTCSVTNASSGGTVTTACGSASGSGSLNTTVTMKSGEIITYTAAATIEGTASGNLTNSVTVSPPGGTTDPTPSNNTATDTDTVNPMADLSITKTDGVSSVNASGSTTYTVQVTNNGPSQVAAATVADTPPAGLTFGAWTCAVSNAGSGGTVTTACGTGSGSGNLNTLVTMKSGAIITYTVNATVASTASGSLANTATVSPPDGTTDPTPGNNTATDTNTIIQTGSIGDYVWYDTNHDGIQQPDEKGIAGVTVNLYDGTGTSLHKTTMTDGSGFYAFAGLAADNYVVEFLPRVEMNLSPSPAKQGTGVLANSFDSDADVTAGRVSVSLSTGQHIVTIDAGFYRPETNPANIGDYVWYDTDNDGIQDAGEKGLAGVIVNLQRQNPITSGWDAWASTVSDGNGFYEFAGLPSGNYKIQFITPTGYTLSPKYATGATTPTGKGDDSDVNTTGSIGYTDAFSVVAGATTAAVDCGMVIVGINPASIGNFVWNDQDGNGIQDGGVLEPGIPGIVVNLYNAAGATLIATTQTDLTGGYAFNGLPSGSYVVEFVKPNDSYSFSPTGQGTASTDSNADVTTGRASITLTAGQTNIDMDAGLRIPGTPNPISIGDYVWLDSPTTPPYGDSQPQAGEGLSGAIVVLYDSLGNELARTTTTTITSTSNYTFTGLGNGSYRVEVLSTSLPLNAIEIAERTPDTTYDNMTDLIGLTDLVTNADFGYIIGDAHILIDKKATNGTDSQKVLDPGIAYFAITVTNTGNLTLNQVQVTDPFASSCVKAIGTLAPGAHSTYTCSKDSAAGSVGAPGTDWINSANANGQPVDANGEPVFSPVTDGDTSDVVIIKPAISITKTTTTSSVNTGAQASFNITVTNSGSGGADLTNVAVIDTQASNCNRTIGSLAQGASYGPYTCILDNVTSALTNVAEATGTATSTSTPTAPLLPDTKEVSATDDASVIVTVPGMSITKTTSTPVVRVGDIVTFIIRVTNTGQSALTGVEVTDANAADCNRTTLKGNAIGSIGIGSFSQYTCTQTAGSLSFTNTAIADSAETAMATATAAVTVINPAISIVKKTNDDFPSEPVQLHQGMLVSWIYTVTNTGDTPLTNVAVTDNKGVSVSCPYTELAASQAMTCFGYAPAILGAYSNTGTATGTPPVGAVVTSTEGSSYVGFNLAKIGNYVWLDENGNGIQDAGEPGIANQTVQLRKLSDNSLVNTAKTDANGGYLFTLNIQATGNTDYKLVVIPTSGLNPTYNEDTGTTSPDNQTTVTVAAGVVHLTADFGYNWVTPTDSTNPGASTTGAIGDRIWNDANGDGLQDPGEAGISGVTVTLTNAGADGIFGNGDDPAPVVKQTDAVGNYIFDSLGSGLYKVTVTPSTLPSDNGLTWAQTGDPDGAAQDNQTTTPIVLAPGDVYVKADFGYQPNQGSSIGDTIWFDADADKAQDVDEPGIGGVSVALRNSNGDVIATTLTNANGQYLFSGLPAGTFTVVVDDTNNLLGQLQLSYDPDGGSNHQSTVTLNGTSDNLNQDFGYTAFGEHKNFDEDDGVIGDTIYLDRNGDNNFDAGEGLGGVSLGLYDSTGTILRAYAYTNANGTYSFGRLDINSTYVVKVDTSTLPNGGLGMTNTVYPLNATGNSQSTVPELSGTGGANLDQDFGYRALTNPASIGGTLWNDANADGIYNSADTNPPLGDITVALFDSNGNHIASTITDVNGNYLFAGLPANVGGTGYTVVVTDDHNELEGWWHSEGNQSTSLDNTSKRSPIAVTVMPGDVNTNIDFGYYDLGSSLGNRVWNDANGNGIQDPTETGLAGADVQVIITWPGGGSTTIVSTSDATGLYRYGNLLLDESFNGLGTGQPTYDLSVLNTPPTGYHATVLGQGNYKTDSNNPSGTTVANGMVIKGHNDMTIDAANPTTETDPASYDFGYVLDTAASLVIKTYTNGQDADEPTGPYIKIGDTATWTYTVTNSGTVALNTLVVTDSHAPDVAPAPVESGGYNVGDINSNNALDPLETWQYRATGTAVTGQYANTGTATAKTPTNSVVSDTDDSHYFGAAPGIAINKVTNTNGGDTGSDGISLYAGNSVTWVYSITNTGNVALGGIAVTDNMGVNPAYQGGDVNSNGRLDATEVWIYKTSGIAIVGTYTNLGSASGQPLDGNGASVINPATGLPVTPSTASDASSYTGIAPTDLRMQKSVSTATPPLGTSFTYTLMLTNSGSDSILPVRVIDYVPMGVNLIGMNVPTDWICNPATITPAESLSGGNNLVCDKTAGGVLTDGSTTTFTLTAIATATTNVFNTATVTGDNDTPPTTPDGNNCTGTAAQNCDRTGSTGIKPRIDLTKLVMLTDETGISDGLVQAGEKLTYTFTITNSGDATLKPIELSDAQLDGGSLSCVANTQLGYAFSLIVPADNQLLATDSVTCTGKHTVTVAEAAAGRIDNTAIVVGYSPDATSLLPKGTPWQSTANGLWVNPPPANQALKGQIELTKTAVHNDANLDGAFDADETVTYGFIVRNVGPTVLNNVAVTDALLSGSTISCLATNLAVDEKTTCSVSPAYVLKTVDVQAGQLANTAKVTATDSNANSVTDTDSKLLVSGQTAGLELEKTAIAPAGLTAGDTIAYTLVATNTGAAALTNVTVSDTKLGALTGAACTPPQGSTLASTTQMVCKGTYTVSNGETNPISNIATATGQPFDRSNPISATSNHIGPTIPSISSNLYEIGDKIWKDTNNNGIYEPNAPYSEPGIDGVLVRLLRCDANGENCVQAVKPNGVTLIPDMLTAGGGHYRFTSVPETSPGYPTYRVQVMPVNFTRDDVGMRVLYGASSSATDATSLNTDGLDQGVGVSPSTMTGIMTKLLSLSSGNAMAIAAYIDFGFTNKTVAAAPDLQIIQEVSSTTPSKSALVPQLTYTLTASNVSGAGNVTKIPTISDRLPTNMTKVGNVSTAHWNCNSSTATQIICYYTGSLPVAGGNQIGEKISIPVNLSGVAAGTTAPNTAMISKLTGEASYTNNSATVSVTVGP